MYGFEAYYVNVFTFNERVQLIEVDGQFFDNKKDIYLYAMEKAFDGIKEEECFTRLDFLYC